MNKNKKIFPKLQKKIRGFLTDESGKITKKDALMLSFGAMLFSGISDSFAASPSCSISHESGIANGHFSKTSQPPNPVCNGGYNYNYSLGCNLPSNHSSGIINGHFSNTLSVNSQGHCSHSSY